MEVGVGDAILSKQGLVQTGNVDKAIPCVREVPDSAPLIPATRIIESRAESSVGMQDSKKRRIIQQIFLILLILHLDYLVDPASKIVGE